MKQHINEEQLKEVNLEKIHKLIRGSIERHPFKAKEITIGKMIEILSNYKQIEIYQGGKWWVMTTDRKIKTSGSELVDALWEAVKEVI